uniref:Endonuclease/exonuclease/phosphatase domain-containing protein n=1 Tax=Branchiostoma floridae TaxID=7739 RepID=C4A094_BRAFL|eukprot:XP_002585776.1 hypothetical protein BRAFLDRAFT_111142 [Branchiostoma floridae]
MAASTMKMSAQSIRFKIQIATLNVRGLSQISKRQELDELLARKRVDMCCLQETKVARERQTGRQTDRQTDTDRPLQTRADTYRRTIVVRSRRLRLAGHVVRHGEMAGEVLLWEPNEPRRRGRPSVTLRKLMLEETVCSRLSQPELGHSIHTLLASKGCITEDGAFPESHRRFVNYELLADMAGTASIPTDTLQNRPNLHNSVQLLPRLKTLQTLAAKRTDPFQGIVELKNVSPTRLTSGVD